MRLLFLRRPRPAEQLRVVAGVTRGGTVGVGIFRDEKLAAWGRNESAAVPYTSGWWCSIHGGEKHGAAWAL